MSLETHLREIRDGGRKILSPYLMCGFPSLEVFPDLVRGLIDAGADMFEIGVPFTDPLMDGPVIQQAADAALEGEARPDVVVRTMAQLGCTVPYVFMTYVNPVIAMGEQEFARRVVDAGASGVIIPDLPVDEAGDWLAAARPAGLETVFLAAPTTPRDRLESLVREGSGFVYCVSLLGITGLRSSLSERAAGVVSAVREVTDRPALVGIGVSTPEQAAEACTFADGVVVGTAIIKALQDEGVEGAVRLVKELREAIDG